MTSQHDELIQEALERITVSGRNPEESLVYHATERPHTGNGVTARLIMALRDTDNAFRLVLNLSQGPKD